MKAPVTYFAEFPKVGLLKVGSSVNPERRLRTLLGKKKDLGKFSIVGATNLLSEREAHEAFSTHRFKGEWYYLSASSKGLAKRLSSKNWKRLIPRQFGVWFSKQDRESMMENFPAKSYSASMQKMIQAILDGRIVSKRKTAKA